MVCKEKQPNGKWSITLLVLWQAPYKFPKKVLLGKTLKAILWAQGYLGVLIPLSALISPVWDSGPSLPTELPNRDKQGGLYPRKSALSVGLQYGIIQLKDQKPYCSEDPDPST